MGYCMVMEEAEFRIPANKKAEAFAALGVLDRDGTKHGGSWAGGKQTAQWFSWVSETWYADSSTLEEAFNEWRWPVVTNEAGDIIDIEFEGEKYGDEDQLFTAIAPFVDEGSYIQMQGEDGERWRWTFHDGVVRQIEALIVWRD